MAGSPPPRQSIKSEHKAGLMAKAVPAVAAVELDCADEGLALEMARWLTHLRAERRLSPRRSKPMPATSANASFSAASIGAVVSR